MLPLTNRIADQYNVTGGITAIMQWDSTVFDKMLVPDSLDRDLVINTIIMDNGARQLMNPNPDYLKWAMEVWSRRMLPIWNKLIETTKYDYNPIHNYDRHEEVTDVRKVGHTRDLNNTYSENGSFDGTTHSSTVQITNVGDTAKETTQHDVSAENTSDYQPENLDTREGSNTRKVDDDIAADGTETQKTNTTGEGTQKENETTDDSYTHKAYMYGNIGVTTTQQMIEQEREVVRFDIIAEISHDWAEEFCLYVW